jgi:Uma2 family endonuclease
MNAATIVPKKKLTEAEYLAIENAAPFKSDFFDGVMYPVHGGGETAMAGANPLHNRIKENLVGELFSRFGDGPCQSYSSDQRVKLSETGRFAYPDIVIVCEPPVFMDSDPNTLANPQVVIEVLSPTTEEYDHGFKFAQYRLQSTIREVVFVSQDKIHVERHVRQADDSWLPATSDSPAADFSFGTLPVTIPVSRIYRGTGLLPT